MGGKTIVTSPKKLPKDIFSFETFEKIFFKCNVVLTKI